MHIPVHSLALTLVSVWGSQGSPLASWGLRAIRSCPHRVWWGSMDQCAMLSIE